jgi:hypothetical protein
MNESNDLPDAEPRDKGLPGAGGRDAELVRAFAILRQEDEQHVPEFATLWRSRRQVPRGKARWLVAAACALVVAAVFLWLRSAQRRPEGVAVASIAEWKAPTDFLLESPGLELLGTVPEIGQWRGYTAPTEPEARPSPVEKKFL